MRISSPSRQIVPTANALESRLRIFQPVQARPRAVKNQKIETPWGSARITGRLGQRHADLLESIRFCAEKTLDRAGKLWLLVDPYKLRQKMGEHYSFGQLNVLKRELTEAVIEYLEESETEPSVGHLIDNVIVSTAERPDPLSKSQRKLWAVEIGIPGRKILFGAIRLYYDPGPIARLKSGICQAIARHVLTHKNEPSGGWKLDTLIKSCMGEEIKSQAIRDRRREVKKDEAKLRECGIVLDGDRVHLLKIVEAEGS